MIFLTRPHGLISPALDAQASSKRSQPLKAVPCGAPTFQPGTLRHWSLRKKGRQAIPGAGWTRDEEGRGPGLLWRVTSAAALRLGALPPLRKPPAALPRTERQPAIWRWAWQEALSSMGPGWGATDRSHGYSCGAWGALLQRSGEQQLAGDRPGGLQAGPLQP